MSNTSRYERIGKLLYGVQRLGGPERLLALGGDAQVDPALAACARQLAQRQQTLMAAVGTGQPLDDDATDALLDGVPEMLATLADDPRQ